MFRSSAHDNESLELKPASYNPSSNGCFSLPEMIPLSPLSFQKTSGD